MKNQTSKINIIHWSEMFRMTKQAGFTLIETLVALSIFTTAILSIIAIAPVGISTIVLAQDKTTASYLAQEGIDLVRAYRDDGAINTVSDPLSAITAVSTIDANLVINSCLPSGAPICPSLHHSSDGFVYGVAGQTGLFTRTITATLEQPDEYKVISTVSWTKNGHAYSVSYQTNLTNWRSN